MKFVAARPFADPDAAARKLVEIANAAEAVQDDRIHIELITRRFLNAGDPRPNRNELGVWGLHARSSCGVCSVLGSALRSTRSAAERRRGTNAPRCGKLH